MTALTKADIALYQKLHRRAVRETERLWLVEGPNAVHAALRGGLSPVCILAQSDSLIASLPNSLVVNEATLARIASTDSAPPMLGIFHARPLIDHPQAGQRWLGLAGLQDPGNVGTLIRCLRAFHGDGVIMTADTVDLYSPKVIRATAGEVFLCPLHQVDTLPDMITAIPDGTAVYATRAQQATHYQQADWSAGGVLLLGQEGNGLDTRQLPERTQWLCVPQNPAVDSLNVAVCGAIMMAQWV